MVAVSLRVPLRWVVHKSVKIVRLTWLFNFLQHSVLFLQRFPLFGLVCLRIYGRDDNFGFSKLAYATWHIFILNREVLVSNTSERNLVNILRVLTVIKQEVAFFGLIASELAHNIIALSLALGLVLGNQKVSCLIERSLLCKEDANTLLGTLF